MTRQGLKRLECADGCGCIAYMTLAQLERHGMPLCPCGAGLVPDDLEVAAAVCDALTLEQVPTYREYLRKCQSVAHGQKSHVQRGRVVQAVEQAAADATRRAVVRAAQERKRAGLRQNMTRAAEAAAMPF